VLVLLASRDSERVSEHDVFDLLLELQLDIERILRALDLLVMQEWAGNCRESRVLDAEVGLELPVLATLQGFP